MASGATGTYGLPYPLQTDPVDVATDMQLLATDVEVELLKKAPLISPAFSGNPTAPTPSDSDNDTSIATTAFVKNQSYLTTVTASTTYATIASPTFTGVPAAPTATLGTNTTQIATTAFVANALSNFVTLPSQSGANGKFLKSNGTNASWQTITTTDVSGLDTVINGLSSTYAPLNVTIKNATITANAYTLILTDASNQIEMNQATTANTLYIPTDASVAFPVGTTIIVAQMNTGQTTIAATTPGTTTVVGTPGLKLRTQYSMATLVKRAANYWIVTGDLMA